MQWVLMALISILAGIIAGGVLWMAMGMAPQLAAAYRARQERRVLTDAAAQMEEKAKGDEER